MVFKIALLLLGPSRSVVGGISLALFGLLLMAGGGFLIIDASDRNSLLVVDVLGALLLAVGMIEGVYAALTPWDHRSPERWCRAFLFMVSGAVVFFAPATVDYWDPLILALAFIGLGIYKMLFSFIGRFPHWDFVLMGGCLHFLLGVLLFNDWRHHSHWMVPLLFGIGLILLGVSAFSNAWVLRQEKRRRASCGETHYMIDYYLKHHVGTRCREAFKKLPPLMNRADTGPMNVHEKGENKLGSKAAPHDLCVHIWLPRESADNEIAVAVPLISTYLAAQEVTGRLSFGHSALELPPDVYISHYTPKEYEQTVNGVPIRRDRKEKREKAANKEHPKTSKKKRHNIFSWGCAHDQAGIFFDSHERETACWMPPNRTLRFRRFNACDLRDFWRYYRQDTTYNIVQRNCSVSVVLALDMALLGCLRGSNMPRRFLRLLCHHDLWVAAFIRRRAADMAWTPGLVLNYASALVRVFEKEERFLPREVP